MIQEKDTLLLKYLDGKFEEIEIRLDNYNNQLEIHKSRQDELQAYVRENDAISAAATMQTFTWYGGILLTVILFLIGTFFSKSFGMFQDIWKKMHING